MIHHSRATENVWNDSYKTLLSIIGRGEVMSYNYSVRIQTSRKHSYLTHQLLIGKVCFANYTYFLDICDLINVVFNLFTYSHLKPFQNILMCENNKISIVNNPLNIRC